MAIFCFHFDYIFSKRKKAFVFAFWFIYITVIKELKHKFSLKFNSILVQLALDFKNKKKIETNRPIFKKIAQFNLNIVRQLMMMHFDPNWCSWKIDQLLLTHWSKIIQKKQLFLFEDNIVAIVKYQSNKRAISRIFFKKWINDYALEPTPETTTASILVDWP